MTNSTWVFPSNNNAEVRGINDAGIQTFASKMYESLVRESIQNSLDAKKKTLPDDVPVEVFFQQEQIKSTDLPGKESLMEAFKLCNNIPNCNSKTQELFSTALDRIEDKSIRILKISDYNTTGLDGGSTGEIGSSWSKLVKEVGTNDKDSVAGGSYGIGKAAYYACSEMRTIFISSLSENGEKSSIGVSKLISFQLENGDLSNGIGYYANTERFLAFPELVDFDGCEPRTKSGTDIYVIGNYLDPNGGSLSKTLIKNIITNFLVSLYYEKLIVHVNDEIIDKAFLESYFKEKLLKKDDLNKEEKTMLDYYLILSNFENKNKVISLNSSEYGFAYGFHDNECTLTVRKGDDLNRKILVTRKTGMRIFEMKNLSSSISFSGILYVSGMTMNKFFREMETPAHDKWIANEQAKNFNEQKNALTELKKYIKDKLIENFADQFGDEIDAFDAGQFLPDELAISEEENTEGLSLTIQENKVKVRSKDMKPSKKKMKAPKNQDLEGKSHKSEKEQEDYEYDTDNSGSKTGTGENEGIGTFNSESPGHTGTGTGTGDNPGTGTAPTGGNQQYPEKKENEKKTSTVKYKEIDVSMRVIAVNASTGMYKLVFTAPNKAKTIKLDFSIAGEQFDTDIEINNARILSCETASIVKIEGNSIYLNDVKKDEKLIIVFSVDFYGYCMMEVNYNESKK